MDGWADRKLRRRLRRELLRETREKRTFAWETRGGWRGALALWGRAGTPLFFAASRDRSDR